MSVTWRIIWPTWSDLYRIWLNCYFLTVISWLDEIIFSLFLSILCITDKFKRFHAFFRLYLHWKAIPMCITKTLYSTGMEMWWRERLQRWEWREPLSYVAYLTIPNSYCYYTMTFFKRKFDLWCWIFEMRYFWEVCSNALGLWPRWRLWRWFWWNWLW